MCAHLLNRPMLPGRKRLSKPLTLLSVFFFVSFLSSCILKEFKFEDVHLKENWDLGIITPLFHADFDFGDLIHDWENIEIREGEKLIYLKSQGQTIAIPERYIYDPTEIIDTFNFLIDGEDYLTDGEFIYTVSNGSPFPFHFQMNFFDKNKPDKIGPAILPSVFTSGNISDDTIVPGVTESSLKLTIEQLLSFKNSNRIRFTTWFDPPNQFFNTDSIEAEYPIQITIVFKGAVDSDYE